MQFPDIFGIRARRESNERIARFNMETARAKTTRARVAASSRAMMQILKSQPTASLSGLSNELYPEAEKSNGSMRRYSTTYAGDNSRIRRLSRIALFESPAGAAMIGRLAETVIGQGLRLRLQPYWDIIDPAGRKSPEDRAQWVHSVEQRYRLWSNSYSPEYNTRRNLPQLSRAAFEYLLQDGEYFALLRYSNVTRGNPLTIQLIPPENIQGGSTSIPGNEIVNGIEYDTYGQEVAYHILDDKTGQTSRVQRFGARSGRVYMIHSFLTTNEKQKRGVPYFANCIEEFAKLGQYEALEIQAAIVNAMFAVWVEPPADMDGTPVFGAGSRKKASEQTEEITSSDTAADEYISRASTLDFTKGGTIIDALPAGHKPHSFDTNRPNVNFSTFYDAVIRNISASRGEPVSAVQLNFNQSYTGARGELLMFWMTVNRFRCNHGWDFEDDIFQSWFAGEIDRRRIDAPGFFESDELRLAYTNAIWLGNRQPDIDPVKSVTAAKIEHDRGYRTGDEITSERSGGDYSENVKTISQEFANLKASGSPEFQVAPASIPIEPDEDVSKTGANQDDESIDFDNLKQEMDSYGVAVRAGAITPQYTDEDYFRAKAGFPIKSPEAVAAWSQDGGVRRPITLALPGNPQLDPNATPSPDTGAIPGEENV